MYGIPEYAGRRDEGVNLVIDTTVKLNLWRLTVQLDTERRLARKKVAQFCKQSYSSHATYLLQPK